MSFEQAALIMGSTPYKLRKLFIAYQDEMIDVTRFHAGRPLKEQKLTNAQMNDMVSHATLVKQAGLNLETRKQ